MRGDDVPIQDTQPENGEMGNIYHSLSHVSLSECRGDSGRFRNEVTSAHFTILTMLNPEP